LQQLSRSRKRENYEANLELKSEICLKTNDPDLPTIAGDESDIVEILQNVLT